MRLWTIGLATACCLFFAPDALSAENSDVAVLRTVEPAYPREALLECVGGTATLHFVVTPQGQATDIRIVQSAADGVFDEAAIDAVRQWQFKPRIVNGEPVQRAATIPLEFREARGCEEYRRQQTFENVLIACIALLFAFELFIALRWPERLWGLGLPLFTTSRRVPFGARLPDVTTLNAMPGKGLGPGPAFVFRRFSNGDLAFRESLRPSFGFRFHYSPLMRARIFL